MKQLLWMLTTLYFSKMLTIIYLHERLWNFVSNYQNVLDFLKKSNTLLHEYDIINISEFNSGHEVDSLFQVLVLYDVNSLARLEQYIQWVMKLRLVLVYLRE